MVVAAAGREPDRAGVQRLGQQIPHRGDVRVGRVGAREGAIAHDVDPERVVWHVADEIGGVVERVERVEVVGEALPRPGQPLRQGGARDVLDALHQGDQARVIGLADGREAHAAVAHHHRRDPVPGRGRQIAVPRGLAVVVRVQIGEARRDDRAVGVDRAARLARDPTDLDHATVVDPHVGGEGGLARPVDHLAARDLDVEHTSLRLWAG